LKILLAEDNLANQLVAEKLLAKMGHHVEIVANGRMALDRLEHTDFDVVLMDCQMPVLDGYEATRQLRLRSEERQKTRIPVVALTAYAMVGDREKCLAAGMDDYVTKPIREAELKAALERCKGLEVKNLSNAREESSSVLNVQLVRQMMDLPGENGPSLWPELLAVWSAEKKAWDEHYPGLFMSRQKVELESRAHRFGGSCAAVGAEEMQSIALSIERAAQAGDWPLVETESTRLQNAESRLQGVLRLNLI
jgi:CheY-like chemotaxis protein